MKLMFSLIFYRDNLLTRATRERETFTCNSLVHLINTILFMLSQIIDMVYILVYSKIN